jgi:hypothetical protein
MAAALALPLTDAARASIAEYAGSFLRPDMRHSRFTLEDIRTDAAVHPLVRQGYPLLHRLAAGELAADADAFWRPWAQIEAEVDMLAPVLRHIDRVENDLRCAQRSLLGPLQLWPQLWRKLRGT